MSPRTFPVVSRAPGNRGHSGFPNTFTYKWVLRVSLERKEETAFSGLRGGPGKKSSARRCPGFRCQQVTRRVEVFFFLEE